MKVSVLLPTHNRAELLSYAIDSFLMQDYPDKELLILMDGCTDATEEVLQIYKDEKEIKIFKRDKPNAATAVNLLWRKASGYLLCNLHDDDMMFMEKSISSRVELFKNNPFLEVVYGGVKQSNGNIYLGEAPNLDRLLKHDYINFTTLMWRREIQNKFMVDEELNFQADWMFKIRCLKECNTSYVEEPVMWYNIHDGQETRKGRLSGETEKETILVKEKLKQLYGTGLLAT